MNLIKNLFLIIISTIVSLFLFEGALRISGITPHKKLSAKKAKIFSQIHPISTEKDLEIGWVNKPGTYLLPDYKAMFRDYNSDSNLIMNTIFKDYNIIKDKYSNKRINILNNRSRITKINNSLEDKPKAFVMGCSVTFGDGVSDEETFSFHLQSRIQWLNIENYGTPGHGTYQLLLQLERLYKQNQKLSYVIYGFGDFHELRNLRTLEWYNALNQQEEKVAVPYASLNKDENAIIRFSPTPYPSFPLNQKSSLMSLLEVSYVKWLTRKSDSQKEKLMENILLEINKLTSSNGSKFIIMFLIASEEKSIHYKEFLRKNNIDFVDCRNSDYPQKYNIPMNNHPDGELHEIWGKCIADHMDKLK